MGRLTLDTHDPTAALQMFVIRATGSRANRQKSPPARLRFSALAVSMTRLSRHMLLESQAQDDRLMALRILTCTGLLLLELARNQPPEVAGHRLPAVLPLVLYNGIEP